MIVDPRDRWMDRAACIGSAPAYDETAEQWQQRRAAAVCLTRCPVLEDCRQFGGGDLADDCAIVVIKRTA